MDTSHCDNCGEPIFYGPRKQTNKDDTTASTIVWRHVNTESHNCKVTYATPITEREKDTNAQS